MQGATGTLRDSIENLLRADQGAEHADGSGDVPAFMTVQPMDYDAVEVDAAARGRKLMMSLLEFYLDEEVIDDNEYIRAKAAVASMQLSGLITQMRTQEHAIKTLLKVIHSGNFSPRMFEVLTQMQKALLDIQKMQTMQMLAHEEGFKKLRNDLGAAPKRLDGGDRAALPPGGDVQMGSRDMMKDIQAELGREEPEDDES